MSYSGDLNYPDFYSISEIPSSTKVNTIVDAINQALNYAKEHQHTGVGNDGLQLTDLAIHASAGIAQSKISNSVRAIDADKCDGQHLGTGNTPIFAGLTLNGALSVTTGGASITGTLGVTGDITVTGTVDGVDVAALKSDVDGFPDALKNLVTAEINQLENIASTTISAAQWGYLGAMNQGVASGNGPSFTGLNLTSHLDMNENNITAIGTLGSSGNYVNTAYIATLYLGDAVFKNNWKMDDSTDEMIWISPTGKKYRMKLEEVV